MRIHFAVASIVLAWSTLAAAGIYGIADDLQPKDYRSPSGTTVLHVVPDARSGEGPATYTLKRSGAVAWSGKRELTLWDGAVSDSGIVVGYAYDEGFNGSGQFAVVRIDVDGTFDRLVSIEREHSDALHSMPYPQGHGAWIDETRDRFVVRVDPLDSTEQWWSFELGSGRELARITPPRHPKADAWSWIVDARPVRGSELAVVQWHIGGDAERTELTLVDDEGRTRWSRRLESGPAARFESALVEGRTNGTFGVRDSPSSAIVTYRVDSAGDKPKVTTVGRALPPEERDDDYDAPLVELEHLGSLTIGQRRSDGALPAAIDDFAFDANGRFAVLERTDCEQPGDARVVVVDRHGAPLRHFTIPSGGCSASGRQIAWAGGEQWLLAMQHDESKTAVVWLIDAGTGGQRKLDALEAPAFDAVAAGGGRVFGLAMDDRGSTVDETLRAFDLSGRTSWVADYGVGDGGTVFSGEDVTVTTAGQVVLLENVSKKLKIFEPGGKHVATVKLADAWGYEPNYPTSIASDGAGGVVVFDFDGPNALVRMGLDGRVLARFKHAFADGRTFHPQSKVTGDGDGHYWTSDGFSLLRLDATGRVVEILGQVPDSDRLGSIAALEIRRDGTVFAADHRTGSVHVFDSQGRALRICKLDPKDLDGNFGGELSADAHGNLVVQPDTLDNVYVRFDGECKRQPLEAPTVTGSAELVLQPDGGKSWVLAYKAIQLVDASGAARVALERGPSGEWIRSPGPAGIAPDGAIAVVLNDGEMAMTPRSVAVYSPNGDVLASWPAPKGVVRWARRLAFDGERVVLPIAAPSASTVEELLVLSRDGSPKFRFKPKLGRAPTLAALVGEAETTELWLFDGRETIDRFAWRDR